MAYVIVQNTREGGEPVRPSSDEDGKIYPYGMYYEGGRSIAWAHDFDDLMEVLRPGYQTQSEANQFIERIRLAMEARTHVQAVVYAGASDEDLEALTPEQDALINGTKAGRVTVDDWTSEIPLVLVSTAYQPYTDTPRPVSHHGPYLEVPNLYFINPESSETLLTDLHSIEYVRVVRSLHPGEGTPEV